MAELSWQENDGVLIARLVVSGSLSPSDIDSIGQDLMKLHENSAGKILLDLRDVKFIYSAVLGKLLALQKKCGATETDLKLCNVLPVIMEVMKIARFDEILEIHPSEQEAMAAFGVGSCTWGEVNGEVVVHAPPNLVARHPSG